MVWLKWSRAAVITLACVGVSWGQAPVPTSSGGPAQGTLTIHENGKSTRCRVLASWTTREGSKAYQLQALENNEMITIVEDGAPTTLREPLLEGKVKSVPMRIFHWGNRHVPPPGVPTPPQTIITVGATIPGPTTSPAPAPIAPTNVPMAQGSVRDQIIWWEEKSGKRVSPEIVTNGNNPFSETAPIHTVPRSSETATTFAEQKTSGVPVIIDREGSSTIIATTPDASSVQKMPTTAAAASYDVPLSSSVPAPQPTLWDKVGNLFHPKHDPNAATQAQESRPADQPKTMNGPASFSTARMEDKSGDILLAPEKFDPVGNKMTPRGINMGAFRGDPNQLMANDGNLPLGAKSVLAASGGAPTNVTYVPVPMATVPDVNHPPVPPAPPLPNTSFTNAFTSPPPLPGGYPPPPELAKVRQPDQPVQPVQYSSVPVPPAPTVSNPAMDRHQAPAAGTSGADLTQIVRVLRESPYPAQREWAANTLGTYDARSRPELVQLLVTVAQQDPAATVRAACAYSLGRTQSDSELVLKALRGLRDDGDARVRQEAEQALTHLSVANQR